MPVSSRVVTGTRTCGSGGAPAASASARSGRTSRTAVAERVEGAAAVQRDVGGPGGARLPAGGGAFVEGGRGERGVLGAPGDDDGLLAALG
ncbi:hypothetical protein [Streptomyces sp. IMTB 2501]|uniref:hypothetical protein n=1 Tax=Streptomyces sp. IMTB 2501 TaxID=1776340 RepID=UPI0015B84611|nr:hypothetical protein [Streptomyces sp. IMTB 2501]